MRLLRESKSVLLSAWILLLTAGVPARAGDPENRKESQKHYLYGVVLYQQGNLDKAREKWTEALKLDPDNPDLKAAFRLLDERSEPQRPSLADASWSVLPPPLPDSQSGWATPILWLFLSVPIMILAFVFRNKSRTTPAKTHSRAVPPAPGEDRTTRYNRILAEALEAAAAADLPSLTGPSAPAPADPEPADTLENRLDVLEKRGPASRAEKKVLLVYRKAAAGVAKSQYDLALMAEKGRGLAVDHAAAARWYRKAAEQGYGPAQYRLGLFCFGGIGTAKDRGQAADWFHAAAEQDHSDAQYRLASQYYLGRHFQQDYAEALRWYAKAAHLGHREAQYCLGTMCELGQGMAPDRTQAKKWYKRAAGQGHTQAKDSLRDL